MPQQALDGTGVAPTLERVNGERVPQGLTADGLAQLGGVGGSSHRSLKHALVHVMPPSLPTRHVDVNT